MGHEGWGALAAEHFGSSQARDYLTSVSLDGANAWQTSEVARPYSLRGGEIESFLGLNNSNPNQGPRADAFDRLMSQSGSSLLEQDYASLHRDARSSTAELGALLSARFGSSASQPVRLNLQSNRLAAQLNMIAKLVALREELGMTRQIFYVRMGGYDVHDNQNSRLPKLFGSLANTLAAFQDSLDGLGVGNNVTTFTASDFGRSLNSNGDGTDHGWGNHLFAMGGAVNGGQIIGTLPVLDKSGPDSVRNGRILPTMAACQYAASLLDWLGLDEAQVNRVLPTLSNFPTGALPLFS